MTAATLTRAGTLAEHAAAVVAALGGTWQVETDPFGDGSSRGFMVFASDVEGRRVRIVNADRYDRIARLAISDSTPSKRVRMIRCSVDRGAEAIARDVERRLLPGMLEALSTHDAEKLAEAEDEARRADLAERLAGIIGGQTVGHAPGRVLWSDHRTHGFNSYGEANVNRAGTEVKVTAEYLRPDEAERVMRLLATMRLERGQVTA